MLMNDLAKKAAEAVDKSYLIDLAQRFIRVRSVFEPDKGNTELEAAQFIAGELEKLGLEPTLQEVSPGRPNVIADWSGTSFEAGNHKTLMFEGHTDVVTEGDPKTWTYDPFAAQIVEDRLYGRGSADMKGGIAAALAALKAVQQVVPDLAGRIRMGIVVDEEGLMLGIKEYIRQGWADEVDGAIICEPEENELCLFQKGAMRVSVQLTGVMSHGAMPYAGVNPIAALSRFIEKVKGLEQSEQARLGEHPYLGLPWLTPTIVQAPARGEAQLNVMPAEAYLALDIRTVPGQDHDVLEQTLQSFARAIEADSPRLSIKLELFESRPWTETPKDDPLVQALEMAYPMVLNQPPKYGGVPGATDGTFLRAWANIPIVTVGPGDRTIPHQKDEFVRLDELLSSAQLYAAAVIYYFMKEN
ncbi:MAG: M20 family metallopeptidase [Trueperaceae bacterium]|nr:M20 family metallopeptidase [Trueperaceae bacterium]